MNRTAALSALALLALSSTTQAQTSKWNSYIPRGYTLEGVTQGDLNNDGRFDAALKLFKTGDPDGSRALLVLLQTSSGEYTRAGLGQKILACRKGCGGAFYGLEPVPVNIRIKIGVLLVSQDHGSRNIQSYLFRLRLNKTGVMDLIGLDFKDDDRIGPNVKTVSYNFLTGEKLLETFQKNTEGLPMRQTSVRSKSDLSRQTLEQVDYDALQMKLENG